MGSLAVRLLVLQPTPFCNIACKYCYLSTTSNTNRMTLETVERTFQRVFEHKRLTGSHLNVLWHAGEPLVMPVGYYDSSFVLLKKYAPKDIIIQNTIQTNGTLITDEWSQLFKEYDVRVGISLDGAANFHDMNRINRNGMGTYRDVMRGIDILTKAGVRFGIFPVITNSSVDHPEEFWEAIKDIKTRYLALNFEEVQIANTTSSLDVDDAHERVRLFLRTLLQLRDRDRPDMAIRECDNPEQRLAILQGTHRRLESIPLGIINVAWNGDFSTFDPQLLGTDHESYGRFVHGNVHHNEIMEALDHPVFKKSFADIIAGIHKCKRECSYYRICGGGSPSNKLSECQTFDSSETLACRLRLQAPADVAIERLQGTTREAACYTEPGALIRAWIDAKTHEMRENDFAERG